MKKLRILLVALVALLVIPFGVRAEEATDEAEDKAVNVYFFHGDGCPHCEEAQTWFDEIEEEYGEKFNLVKYEVWNSEKNSNLMSAVAEVRGETADGVPYIIIGNQSWSGFDESYEETILEKIESEYAQAKEERYDILNYVDEDAIGSPDEVVKEKSTGQDVLILIAILVIGGAVVAGVMYTRKNAD